MRHVTLLQRITHHSSAARSIVANTLLLTLFLAMGVAFAWELLRDTVTVEPFGVPKELAERGYTGKILARRLIDELTKIREGAKTSKNDVNPEVVPNWSQPDIHIPGAAMSLRSIVRYVRESLSESGLYISGEVTRDENDFKLRLRERHGEAFRDVEVGSLAEIDHLLHLGARELMRRIDPYVLAAYLRDSDTEGALTVIEYCLANEPEQDDPWAYNLWGLILTDEGEYERALRRYAQAIEVDDDFFRAISNSGVALSHLKRFLEAAEKHEAAMRLEPDDAYVFNKWGRSLALEGRHKEAVEKYEKALSIDPKSAVAINEWGRALNNMDDFQGAVEKFEIVVRLRPDSHVANSNLGNELRRVKRYVEAEHYLTRAIELDSEYGPAYYNLGLLHEEQRHQARALACYNKALATNLSVEQKELVGQDRDTLLDGYWPENEALPEGYCIQ